MDIDLDDDEDDQDDDDSSDDGNDEEGIIWAETRRVMTPTMTKGRKSGNVIHPIRVIENAISNSIVRCRNATMEEEDDCDDCQWTGPLSSWAMHAATTCSIAMITCPIRGCNYTCSRHALTAHIGSELCISAAVQNQVHVQTEILQSNIRAQIMQEAKCQVGKMTKENTKLHTQLVKEITSRCKVEATNCGLRREVKELKKAIRSLIQEVDHYQQQQHQHQQCATMKEQNDGLAAALEQQQQLKQEARGDERVEERATVRRVDSSLTNNNNDNNDGECRRVGNSRTKKRKKTKTKKLHHHDDYDEDGDDTDNISGAGDSWRVSPSSSLMHGRGSRTIVTAAAVAAAAANDDNIGDCDEEDNGDSSNKMRSAKKRKKEQKKKRRRSLSSSSGGDTSIRYHHHRQEDEEQQSLYGDEDDDYDMDNDDDERIGRRMRTISYHSDDWN